MIIQSERFRVKNAVILTHEHLSIKKKLPGVEAGVKGREGRKGKEMGKAASTFEQDYANVAVEKRNQSRHLSLVLPLSR
jgi:hypothetical protein